MPCTPRPVPSPVYPLLKSAVPCSELCPRDRGAVAERCRSGSHRPGTPSFLCIIAAERVFPRGCLASSLVAAALKELNTRENFGGAGNSQ